jgi:hypothetical protein
MGNGRGGGSSSTVAVSWALRLVLPRHPPRAQRAERGSRRRQAARAHKVAGPPRDGNLALFHTLIASESGAAGGARGSSRSSGASDSGFRGAILRGGHAL